MPRGTPYFERLSRRIRALGGLWNAHLHLDRANTLDATLALLEAEEAGASHLSLQRKHALIPAVHADACYDADALALRVNDVLDRLEEAGTRRADTLVDVTADRLGLRALDQFLGFREERAGRIELRVGAYSPLGFRDAEPARFALLVEGTKRADFIGALPERDDRADYPDHIGFDESVRRMLALAHEAGKPLHLHLDQRNHPRETGGERVLACMRELGLAQARERTPWVWWIHAISPSTYDEARFERLLAGMQEANVGVIVCPSAALSMRQLRPVPTPTANSIARVLDFLAAGIPVRVGSDNICDITSPAGSPDLLDELFVLAHALRFFDVEVLAKLGAGAPLDAADTARVRAHLAEDAREVAASLARRGHAP
jgi:cytosine/adenosine deaminase-related metal-dependent hydrolase